MKTLLKSSMRVLPHVLTLKRTNLARPETRTHSGALNVPWGDLVFEGELKTTDELRAILIVRAWIYTVRLLPAAVPA